MDADYERRWKDYRIRHWTAVLGLVLGLPLAVAFAIFLKLQFDFDTTASIVPVLLFWVALWAWAAFRVTRFPCPRCGTAFNSGYACSTCGLLLNELAQPNNPADA